MLRYFSQDGYKIDHIPSKQKNSRRISLFQANTLRLLFAPITLLSLTSLLNSFFGIYCGSSKSLNSLIWKFDPEETDFTT